MAKQKNINVTRRDFIKTSSSAAIGLSVAPYIIGCNSVRAEKPLMRTFGRLGFEVTTLGLGGQASIQWTPEDVDPVKIILKAFDKGINYYDTSNLYGPSQMNYGMAFKTLNLIPGISGYDETKRRSIFLTSKTHLRWAKGGYEIDGVNNWTNGMQGTKTVDDLKRSLSQVFGDGKGNYPQGAYLDMVLIHSLSAWPELEVLYDGLDNPDPKAENIGALAALRDYRDGTNLTGLNPKEEKLVRHIGFSGHYNPALMMDMIQRDKDNLIDAMLVAINANDKRKFNMQHNVIPVAAEKNMGIIAMKVFADGAMYTKPAEWSNRPDHVVRTVGSSELSSRRLVEYSLTTPGIHTAIIGIGQISNDPAACQLTQNMAAAQIMPDALTQTDREEIENMAKIAKEGNTNYFQKDTEPLTAPQNILISQQLEGDKRKASISWHTAYAGDAPIDRYEIWRDGQKVTDIPFKPQTTKVPFSYSDALNDRKFYEYTMKTVDKSGRVASSEKIPLEIMA
ncbi:MAG: aldo/keto reductase [Bacteroidales bacterium]|nr:aldo/keto reductase [Bacteroidales bacterium]